MRDGMEGGDVREGMAGGPEAGGDRAGWAGSTRAAENEALEKIPHGIGGRSSMTSCPAEILRAYQD